MALIVCVPDPTALGAYDTEQFADAPLPESVQVPPPPNAPEPLLPKLTVPVGVAVVPNAVSVTVAVQVAAWPIAKAFGEQVSCVDDVPGVTVTSVAPLLAVCVKSPP